MGLDEALDGPLWLRRPSSGLCFFEMASFEPFTSLISNDR